MGRIISTSASSSRSSPAAPSPASSSFRMLDRADMENRILGLTKRISAQQKYLLEAVQNLISKRDRLYKLLNDKANRELAQDLNAFEDATIHRTKKRCIELIKRDFNIAKERIPARQEKIRKLIPQWRITLGKLNEEYTSTFNNDGNFAVGKKQDEFLAFSKKQDRYAHSNLTLRLTHNLVNTYTSINAKYYAAKASDEVKKEKTI